MDSNDFGKEFQALTERLHALERAVGALGESLHLRSGFGCGAKRKAPRISLMSGGMQPRPKEKVEPRAVKHTFIKFVGHDTRGTNQSGPGEDQFRYLAFQLDGGPYGDTDGVWDAFWNQVVPRAQELNYSAPDDAGATDPLSSATFFGVYNITRATGGWIYVYTGFKTSNGACAGCSQSYYKTTDGVYVSFPEVGCYDEWVTINFRNGPYLVPLTYGDDGGCGVSFGFGRVQKPG